MVLERGHFLGVGGEGVLKVGARVVVGVRELLAGEIKVVKDPGSSDIDALREELCDWGRLAKAGE